jgi:hypothetical protein
VTEKGSGEVWWVTAPEEMERPSTTTSSRGMGLATVLREWAETKVESTKFEVAPESSIAKVLTAKDPKPSETSITR